MSETKHAQPRTARDAVRCRKAEQPVMAVCLRCEHPFAGEAGHQYCGICIGIVAAEIARAQVGRVQQ